MKIIRVSNFDYEDWRGNQRVVASGIANDRRGQIEAKIMCDALNVHEHESSDDLFKVVADDHRLRKDWEP